MEGLPEDCSINTCLKSFGEELSNVLSYLTDNPAQKLTWVNNIKTTYDHLVDVASYNSKIKNQILLPELLVDGFDDEQMWQQIELINNVLIKSISNDIKKSSDSGCNISDQEKQMELDKMIDDTLEPSDIELPAGDNEDDDLEENENEENENEEEEDEKLHSNDEKKLKDMFFDMNEMDKILDEQEKKEAEEGTSDEDESDEKPDIFNAESEDDDEEDDPTQQSTAEKERLKLEKKINLHEEESLQARPWQMKGESAVKDRDQNALLAEDLQFEHGARPAPEVTLETTNKLEKLIIERVKAKLFDDVERKEKPVGRDVMKEVKPLNQEKSQLSLAEVYEKDYVAAQEKQQEAEKEDIDVNQEQIKVDLDLLFRKLDALSNFVYTPKAIRDEIKIVVNAPAISMEEAIPTGVADAQILAPNEIKAKQKEELRTTVEETSTDKKRKRRKIKKAKSLKAQEREVKKLKKERSGAVDKVKTKSDAIKTVEREVKKGISIAKQSSEKLNSNFFSKLQDSVDKEPTKKSKKKKDSSDKKFSKY